jgi:predicted RNA-binding Zn-ribbon protein involved in translation (DUF1610 family)
VLAEFGFPHDYPSTCTGCGTTTATAVLGAMELPACPNCGNRNFTCNIEVTQTFLPNGTIKLQQKDPLRRSSEKVRREHFLGMNASADGQLKIKERLWGKDSDVYYEYVKDPKTGEVVHICHEKLTEHRGRGSAKFPAPTNDPNPLLKPNSKDEP